MTYEQAYEYLNHHGWSKTKRGFERARELLEALGNPQRKLKFIHVAGTNGKGSTCAMLEAVMRSAGYKTGLFPSPFIEDFTERIQINGENISREDLARITQTVADAADRLEDHPAHFELITAIGMLYFVEQGCDIVILEVGMGGERDATNVIDAPEAAVICNIGLDHTEFLGDTVERIAEVKAGIIKTGADVVVYDNIPSVMEVIERKAEQQHCRMHRASDIEAVPVASDLHGQRFTADGIEYRLALLGRHQIKNAQVVLMTVRVMRSRGWSIGEDAVREGLSSVKWPVRFEVMGYDPVFIIDGGHNPQCAQAMAESIEEYLPEQKITLIVGMLADKDYRESIRRVIPYAAECLTITPDNDLRALSAQELADVIRREGCRAQAVEADTAQYAVKRAIELAVSKKRPVAAFGSLYAAGTIRSCYRELYGDRKQMISKEE